MGKLSIKAIHPNHITSIGTGRVALFIISALNQHGYKASILSTSSDKSIKSTHHEDTYSALSQKLVYRLFSSEQLIRQTEKKYLAGLESGDIAYLFPGCSLWLYKEIKNRGHLIIVEFINCHIAVVKEILDREVARTSILPFNQITQDDVELENEKLKYVDYIFSPSQLVTQSILDNCVSPSKVMTSSFGIDPSRQLCVSEQEDKSKKFTAIFIGRIGVRKGCHLLLEYWKTANIDGQLLMAGKVENSMASYLAAHHNDSSVIFLDYVSDINELLLAADLFIFPSLEEGSPLVVYEAIAAGLPCLVSPMGGGGIVEHNKHGLVIDPHEDEQWVTALKELARNNELRSKFGKNAEAHSNNYLWNIVGQKRATMLLDKLKLS